MYIDVGDAFNGTKLDLRLNLLLLLARSLSVTANYLDLISCFQYCRFPLRFFLVRDPSITFFNPSSIIYI